MLAAARPTTTLSMVPTSNVRRGTSPVAVDDHSVITSAGAAQCVPACVVDSGDDADSDQLVGPPGVLGLVERGAEKLDAAGKVVVQRVTNILHIGRLQPCPVGGASAFRSCCTRFKMVRRPRVDDS